MYQGIYTALITPFKNDKFDEASFIKILERQIKAGVSGVVPCGTTGESPTLSHDEHNRVIELCVERCKGKIKTIAGTGSNSTQEAIYTTKHAEICGADAALLVSPYYNKPSQEGLYQHFKAIHDATKIDLILYNIPGRSAVNISNDLLVRLAKLPRVKGIKDATADLSLPAEYKRILGSKFSLLSGEDATFLPFLAAGGHGCISVTSNIVPDLCVKLHKYWQSRKIDQAIKIQDQLVELNKVLFCETNPTPVKYAAELVGLCKGKLRLPLSEVSKDSKKLIKAALKNLRAI